jgi:hypothetical protein
MKLLPTSAGLKNQKIRLADELFLCYNVSTKN